MDSITASMTREEIAALLGSDRLYDPGRDSLYTVDELMAGYAPDAPLQSLDARLAAHVKACGIPPEDVGEAIAQVVHDQGVGQAMRAYVAASIAEGRHVVGVMRGSSTPRGTPAYRLAAATAKALSEAGFLVATGGGLGIMEVGNLGAYFAGRSLDDLYDAIDELARCPVYRGREGPYIDRARLLTARQPAGAASLAVATWRYEEELWDKVYTRIPPSPVTAVTVPDNRFTLEGHDLVIVEVGATDSDDTTVLHVPDLGLVVAGDVIYNGVHIYLAQSALVGGFGPWRAAIDKVEALEPRHIVAGHQNKELDDDANRIIDETRRYLDDAEELLRTEHTAVDFFNAKLERYPNHLGRTVVWVGTRVIYGVREHPDQDVRQIIVAAWL